MGPWTFEIESWSDPVATWRHNAEIKIPAGIDVDLMFTEGALLLERLAEQLPKRGAQRKTVTDALTAVRDTTRPEPVRYAAAVSPQIDALLAEHPLRDLVTTTGPYPFFADRERALFSAWYEFFPRSEGAYVDERTGKVVSGTLRTAIEAARRGGGRWASTSSTSRRSTRSAASTARAATTRSTRAPTTPAPRGPSVPTRAATTRSTPSWATRRT